MVLKRFSLGSALFALATFLIVLPGCDTSGPAPDSELDVQTKDISYETVMDSVREAARDTSASLKVYSSEAEEPLSPSQYLEIVDARRDSTPSAKSQYYSELFFDVLEAGSVLMVSASVNAVPAALRLTLNAQLSALVGGQSIILWSDRKSVPASPSLGMSQMVYYYGCWQGSAYARVYWGLTHQHAKSKSNCSGV